MKPDWVVSHCPLCHGPKPFKMIMVLGEPKGFSGPCWCQACHFLVKLEIHGRKSIPPGKRYSIWMRNVDVPDRHPTQGKAVLVTTREAEGCYVAPVVHWYEDDSY